MKTLKETVILFFLTDKIKCPKWQHGSQKHSTSTELEAIHVIWCTDNQHGHFLTNEKSHKFMGVSCFQRDITVRSWMSVRVSADIFAQDVPALTFSCSGTNFGSRLLAYIRCTLRSSTCSKIFLQSRSAALLEGAQARMWQLAQFFSICFMASTRVTVLPAHTEQSLRILALCQHCQIEHKLV